MMFHLITDFNYIPVVASNAVGGRRRLQQGTADRLNSDGNGGHARTVTDSGVGTGTGSPFEDILYENSNIRKN
jgi:hypothetical protein